MFTCENEDCDAEATENEWVNGEHYCADHAPEDDDDDESGTAVRCPACKAFAGFTENATRRTWQPMGVGLDGEEDYDEFDYGDDVDVESIECDECGHEWPTVGHLLIAAQTAGQAVDPAAIEQWRDIVARHDKGEMKRAEMIQDARAWLGGTGTVVPRSIIERLLAEVVAHG